MPYPTLLPNSTWYKSSTNKSNITKVNIVNRYTPTGSENESWSADVGNAGDIKCYRTGTVVTIAGNGSGKIYANADSSNVFNGFGKITAVDGGAVLDTSKATTFERMFQATFALTTVDVSEWDTSNVTTLKAMFQAAPMVQDLDVSNWDVSSVTNMDFFFYAPGEQYYNNKLTSLDVSNWDVSKVTTMSGVFTGCTALQTLDVSNWDVSNVTIMKNMFRACFSATHFDVSNWDVSKVTTMESMFQECSNLQTLDVSNWDVGGVTNVVYMFYKCSKLASLDVSDWDVSSVTSMDHIFRECSRLTSLDVSNWDVSNVTTMYAAFYGCDSLTKITLGTNFAFVGNDHYLPTPSSGFWYDIDKEPFAPEAIPNGAGTYFASTEIVDREAAKPMIVTQGSLLRTAKAIRTKAGNRTGYKPSEFPDGILAIGEVTA